jgi:alkanesulfonate monooxygenase SsuD/methylene tetrahydromethanopterin reductase-like flavin-dependent oxidoreductase (luciferase family)
MVDFGIHGFPDRPAGVGRVEHYHRVLDSLPEAFTTIWVSDHLQDHGDPWPEAWTRAVWLATEFPRFKVGHMMLSQSFRNPGLLAVMAQTLQDLSGGRAILGLGAGWLEEEYRAFNFDFPSPGDRVAQLAEAIELIRLLWQGEPATYDGRWYKLNGAVCEKPDPPIPIMVGTNGPRALKVAARLADMWVWDGPWEPSYRIAYERLQAACMEIGRPFDEITMVCEVTFALPADPTAFDASYMHDNYPGQTFRISGPTPREVADDIQLLADKGVSHFAVNFGTFDEFQRFIADVLPRFG